MPVLGDLYHALRQVNSKAVNNAADALEIYVAVIRKASVRRILKRKFLSI